MKTMALGAMLALSVVSWSAAADDAADQRKMEAQCRAMAEQHGMKDDKLAAWMKKCMEISKQMKDDSQRHDSSGMDDMEDPRDGDQEMGHDMGHMDHD